MPRKANGMSCEQIQKIVYSIKKLCGLENELYFPIVEFAENVLPDFFCGDYSFLVVTKDEMGDKHGETFPDEHIIRIREDVYERAVKGRGRDRMTIAHEVGHLFLHDNNSVSFCRLGKGQKLEAYEDPEWQASCFGGEMLASSHIIQDLTIKEISKKCGISMEAAKIQFSRKKNR